MNLGIDGKVALVLGAGGGLGGAIARALAAEGATVAAAGRTAAKLDTTVAAITAAGGRAEPFAVDLAQVGELTWGVDAIEAALGPIDILINNTGGPPPSTAGGVDPDVWRAQFEAMVLSVFALTDRVLPGMRERGWGRILTSTSSGAIAPIPQLGVSNALRASLHGWSKTLAAEVGADGVTVNVLVPGRIGTDRVGQLDAAKAAREDRAVEDVAGESRARIPLGRYGRPEEYGATAAFLVSDLASYITGSVVRVDGGLIPAV